jgi:hypothetical protein
VVALVFTAITSALLVHDLGRPERFWRLVLKPNTRSWLVRGAWVLMAFGAVTAAAMGLRLGGWGGAADVARVVAVPLAVLASGYSAWLFAQCRGRDLWLEPGLFVRLVLRAALLGAGFAALLPSAAAAPRRAGVVFAVLALANVVAVAVEVAAGRRTGAAHRAHRILAGSIRRLPFVLVASALLACAHALVRDGGTAFACALLATVVVVVVMLVYERAWIRAGQAVPLS